MRLMEPVTYHLQLNTSEMIEILEIDPDRIPILKDNGIQLKLLPILQHCSHVTRLSIEEAKKEHARKLELLLRTPPIGALVKLNMPCALLNNCHMSSRKECTTKNVGKKYGKFPICWTYRTEPLNDEAVQIKDIADNIIHAWRSGQYVLVVNS